ncbi:MAG: tRNA modification GTPase [Phycisphaerales bacterium]|jgi:tRNA modification GTPase
MPTDPAMPRVLAMPRGPGRPVRWSLLTPGSVPAAIGVIGLFAGDGSATGQADLDATLDRLGVGTVQPGEMRLREIAGVDTGLVVRWDPTRADLFPHGGPAVVRAIIDRLSELGLAEDRQPDPRATYPEAESEIEARMLEALSRAASPRAVDLLLDQPRRWGEKPPRGLGPERLAPECLGRLIHPPLVVAIGAPNIGKSSLANALAGRAAALVADEPGTTRDHVGLSLELDGLVVRYLDTPGIDSAQPAPHHQPDPLTAQASARAMDLAQTADLVLLCADALCADAAGPEHAKEAPGGVRSLRVWLRADLAGEGSGEGLWTSASTGLGLGELAGAVRRALVPDEALGDPRPWRFWQRA